MRKLVYGVGINDADYEVSRYEVVNGKKTQVWICPFYDSWVGMLERGYSEKLKVKRPSYREASVIADWHHFMPFRDWMEKQDWQDNHLDKDILLLGNKIYSPNTCAFLPHYVNSLFTDRGSLRGEHPIGVSFRKDCPTKPYRAYVRENGKLIGLGHFTDPLSAHKAWQKGKIKSILLCVERYKCEKFARQDVVDGLISRCDLLESDHKSNKETKFL